MASDGRPAWVVYVYGASDVPRLSAAMDMTVPGTDGDLLTSTHSVAHIVATRDDCHRVASRTPLHAFAMHAAGALLLLIAGSQTMTARPSTVVNRAALVSALRREGVTVTARGRAPREAFPFFSPRATRLSVAGDDVHVFEYASAATAAGDASHISPSGSPIGPHQISWIAPPRFYRKDRVIVLYVGTNPDVARALDAVLGPPFTDSRAPQ